MGDRWHEPEVPYGWRGIRYAEELLHVLEVRVFHVHNSAADRPVLSSYDPRPDLRKAVGDRGEEDEAYDELEPFKRDLHGCTRSATHKG